MQFFVLVKKNPNRKEQSLAQLGKLLTQILFFC